MEKIYKEIKNIYIERHSVSCANIIDKGFGRSKNEKIKYATNSHISYIGVQQCLQVSDYFSKNPIQSTKNIRNPLLIFCCTELIRTQESLFLSWIRYLKDYKENGGKIILLPWLNKISETYSSSIRKTKKAWKKFIDNLKNNFEKIKKDTFNNNSSLITDIENIANVNRWEKLFYLSQIIYKNNKIKINIIKKGLKKKKGDIKQFINLFGEILEKYLEDMNLLDKYDGIELVIVAHHNSEKNFIEYLIPSAWEEFKKIQFLNSEVIKMPGLCLYNFLKKNPNQEPIKRIFPMKYNTKEMTIMINKLEVNPIFIIYISSLDLFLSVNNIVKTRLKAKGINERVQIKKPIYIFLQTSGREYKNNLRKIEFYIKKIIKNYIGKNGPTYYNYNRMLERIHDKRIYFNNFEKNIAHPEFYKKLKDYLFEFCEIEQTAINLIAIF